MKYMRLTLLAAAILLTVSALAQEGHPLDGTWYGDFGGTTGPRRDLTVIMNWDGKAVTGTVNPGKNAVPIKSVTVDIKNASPPPVPAAATPATPAAPPAGAAAAAPAAGGGQGAQGGGGRGGRGGGQGGGGGQRGAAPAGQAAAADVPAAEGAQGGGGLGNGGGRGGGAPRVMPMYQVKFEIDAKNKAGGIDKFVFEGMIENPVAGNRVIRGTWTCGSDKGNFLLRRL
jgi:hypothetical protein